MTEENGEVVIPDITPKVLGLSLRDQCIAQKTNIIWATVMELTAIICFCISIPIEGKMSRNKNEIDIIDSDIKFYKYCGAQIESTDVFVINAVKN